MNPRPLRAVRCTCVALALIVGGCDADAPAPVAATQTPPTNGNVDEPSVAAAPGGGGTAKRSAPEQVLIAFYSALKNGQLDDAQRMILPPSAKRRVRLANELGRMSALMQRGELNFVVHESLGQEPCVLAVIAMRYGVGVKAKTRLGEELLWKQDDTWYVVPQGVRSDPAIKPLMEEHGEPLFDEFRKRMPALREKYH